ncbi:MAG: winged helix-turn-helix transcriptional regulator [Spirochaetales bacterium]|nr:winged helix-turn-helix transcriptional regulator [Spirochaetales bacterium]
MSRTERIFLDNPLPLFPGNIRHRARKRQLDETDRIICTILGESQGLSTHKIVSRLALSDRAVRNRLSKLTSKGIIRAIGTSPRDPNRRYFLTVSTTR